MVKIELSQGRQAIADESDAGALSKHNWHCKRRPNGTCYAATNIRNGGKYKWVTMHRFLLNPPPGFVVDHIDGDGLNNRRDNLRVCSQAENMRNRRGYGSSRFLGVNNSCDGRAKPWSARCNGVFLGYHSTEEEAARAYDAHAGPRYGAFARLNFPEHAPGTPRIGVNDSGTNGPVKAWNGAV